MWYKSRNMLGQNTDLCDTPSSLLSKCSHIYPLSEKLNHNNYSCLLYHRYWIQPPVFCSLYHMHQIQPPLLRCVTAHSDYQCMTKVSFQISSSSADRSSLQVYWEKCVFNVIDLVFIYVNVLLFIGKCLQPDIGSYWCAEIVLHGILWMCFVKYVVRI